MYKEFTCCFTGHRIIPSNIQKNLKEQLDHCIRTLVEKHKVTHFLSGGAYGFDLLAAQCVIDAKERYPQIELALILPFPNHHSKWQRSSVKLFEEVQNQSDHIHIVSNQYIKGVYHLRNKFLINNSRYCIAFLLPQKLNSGTAQTVRYAKEQNTTVHILTSQRGK